MKWGEHPQRVCVLYSPSLDYLFALHHQHSRNTALVPSPVSEPSNHLCVASDLDDKSVVKAESLLHRKWGNRATALTKKVGEVGEAGEVGGEEENLLRSKIGFKPLPSGTEKRKKIGSRLLCSEGQDDQAKAHR
jgi:hypothetical protein